MDGKRCVDIETKGGGSFGELEELWCWSWADDEGSGTQRLFWDVKAPLTSDLCKYRTNEYNKMLDGKRAVFHNAAFDVAVLRDLGVDIPPGSYDDTQIMGYNLNPNMKIYNIPGHGKDQHGLTSWGIRLGFPKLGLDVDFSSWNNEIGVRNRRDAELTNKVLNAVEPRLREDSAGWAYYEAVDRPFIECIMHMNRTGIRINRQALAEWKEEMSPVLLGLEAELKRLTNGYLFPGKRGYRKTKNKPLPENCFWDDDDYDPNRGYSYSHYGDFRPTARNDIIAAYQALYDITPVTTEREYLEEELGNLPFTELLLKYKEVSKLVTTYIEPFERFADINDIVRGSWRQALITGRISCKNPSLQVLPRRGELGSTFRKFVVPLFDDHVFATCDLSNFEVRALVAQMAAFSMDVYGYIKPDVASMMRTLTHSPILKIGDFHAQMADLWGVQRGDSKTITFARVYGQGAKAMAVKAKKTLAEAKRLRKIAAEKNPTFEEYRQYVMQEFYDGGGVGHTYYGRRLVYPNFNLDPWAKDVQYLPNEDRPVHPDEIGGAIARGERQAFNAKFQGLNADVIKMIGNRLMEILPKYGGSLCAIVHDEVLPSVPQEAVLDYVNETIPLFNNVDTLPFVPIYGIPSIGYNWLETH